MFRQAQTNETKPFNTQNISGTVFAFDFDIEREGFGKIKGLKILSEFIPCGNVG